MDVSFSYLFNEHFSLSYRLFFFFCLCDIERHVTAGTDCFRIIGDGGPPAQFSSSVFHGDDSSTAMERLQTKVKRLWCRQARRHSPHSITFPQECYGPADVVQCPLIESERIAARNGALASLDPQEKPPDHTSSPLELSQERPYRMNRPVAIPLLAGFRYNPHHSMAFNPHDLAAIDQLELPPAIRELVGVWARQLCVELGSYRDLVAPPKTATLPIEVMISKSRIDYPGLNRHGFFRVVNTDDHQAATTAVHMVLDTIPLTQLNHWNDITINYLNGIISNSQGMAIYHVDPRQWKLGGSKLRPKVPSTGSSSGCIITNDTTYTGSSDHTSMFLGTYVNDKELMDDLLVYLDYSA